MASRAQHPGYGCGSQSVILMCSVAYPAGHGCGLPPGPWKGPRKAVISAPFRLPASIIPDDGLSFAQMQDHTALTIYGALRD